MSTLKLKVSKSGRVNPVTKKKGFAARVLTNGTAEFEDIVKEAGKNTTMHKAELRMAFELCMDSVTEMLKQGYIVDLGPIGKIYPSCSSGWYEKEEDMKLSDVKAQLYYRAGDEVEAAIKSAKLVWAKASDEDEEEENGGDTPSGGGDTPGGDTPGGDDNGGGGTGTITPDPGTGGGGDNGGGGGDNGGGSTVD
jgi:predicted GNAT family acetyltransferase